MSAQAAVSIVKQAPERLSPETRGGLKAGKVPLNEGIIQGIRAKIGDIPLTEIEVIQLATWMRMQSRAVAEKNAAFDPKSWMLNHALAILCSDGRVRAPFVPELGYVMLAGDSDAPGYQDVGNGKPRIYVGHTDCGAVKATIAMLNGAVPRELVSVTTERIPPTVVGADDPFAVNALHQRDVAIYRSVPAYGVVYDIRQDLLVGDVESQALPATLCVKPDDASLLDKSLIDLAVAYSRDSSSLPQVPAQKVGFLGVSPAGTLLPFKTAGAGLAFEVSYLVGCGYNSAMESTWGRLVPVEMLDSARYALGHVKGVNQAAFAVVNGLLESLGDRSILENVASICAQRLGISAVMIGEAQNQPLYLGTIDP